VGRDENGAGFCGRRASEPVSTGGEYDRAMQRAGRLLAVRPRSEGELRRRLEAADFDRGVIERVIGRLTELSLVDDSAFSRQWVQERSRRGRSGALLSRELEAQGVARATAEAAVAETTRDEVARAAELARRHLRRVAELPLPKQAARLGAMLSRRGYDEEAIEQAVRSVLPPEGWD
jgi:regulatory protein